MRVPLRAGLFFFVFFVVVVVGCQVVGIRFFVRLLKIPVVHAKKTVAGRRVHGVDIEHRRVGVVTAGEVNDRPQSAVLGAYGCRCRLSLLLLRYRLLLLALQPLSTVVERITPIRGHNNELQSHIGGKGMGQRNVTNPSRRKQLTKCDRGPRAGGCAGDDRHAPSVGVFRCDADLRER